MEHTSIQPEDPKKARLITDLYKDDPSSRPCLLSALAENFKDLPQGNLLLCNLKLSNRQEFENAICILCFQANIATELEEPLLVAGFITHGLKEKNPLPDLTERPNQAFCAKVFVALSFFLEKIQQRTKFQAAPAAHTYRNVSQSILKRTEKPGYSALSEHHKAWESYLRETLPIKTHLS